MATDQMISSQVVACFAALTSCSRRCRRVQPLQEVGQCQPLQMLFQCQCLSWRSQFLGQLSLHRKLPENLQHALLEPQSNFGNPPQSPSACSKPPSCLSHQHTSPDSAPEPPTAGRDAAAAAQQRVRSVLLFTDGQANVGVVAPTQLEDATARMLCTDAAPRLLCFGFGADHNADLLMHLAERGNGQSFFM